MGSVGSETVDAADPVFREALVGLVRAATAHDGVRPLSDRSWLALVDGDASGLMTGDPTAPRGWAQITADDDVLVVEVVTAPDTDRQRVLQELLSRCAALAAGRRIPLHWLAADAGEWSDLAAASAGLHPGRELHQLRVALPLGQRTDVATRPFRVGHDEAAWLAVNAAAFDGHPEQGHWTIDDLRRREAEPWFDPDGFRMLDEPGDGLVAFCWTKVHQPTDTDPALGEIYVIAVHPRAHGRGLGRALTVAGLQWLTEQGLGTGMLYVDGGNEPALRLYTDLGFTRHHTDRIYRSTSQEQQR